VKEFTCHGVVPANQGLAYVYVSYDDETNTYIVDATPLVAWAAMQYMDGSLYLEPLYATDTGDVSGRLVYATPDSHPEFNWYMDDGSGEGTARDFNVPALIKTLSAEAKYEHLEREKAAKVKVKTKVKK